MGRLTTEQMWEQMLTGSYPRLHSMLGSDHTADAALGDTVNTAARLTGLAGPGEILISADAATASGLETTELERRTLELRGREQTVDAWVATARRPSVSSSSMP